MTSHGSLLGVATTKVAQPTPASTTANAFWFMAGHQAPKCAHWQNKGCRGHPLVWQVCPKAISYQHFSVTGEYARRLSRHSASPPMNTQANATYLASNKETSKSFSVPRLCVPRVMAASPWPAIRCRSHTEQIVAVHTSHGTRSDI